MMTEGVWVDESGQSGAIMTAWGSSSCVGICLIMQMEKIGKESDLSNSG